MIIVTGGAGFIGSNLVKALNNWGEEDILIVDNLSTLEKEQNLADLEFAEYLDKHEFFEIFTGAGSHGRKLDNVTAVFHQGACSDTMETDEDYIHQNNFVYSKELLRFCEDQNAQFIYASSASVYGDGSVFTEEKENETALNAYAASKLMFDNYFRSRADNITIQCAGLRYFNVYGPREQHKGRGASVAWHFYNQYKDGGKVRLFAGSGGYNDGDQLRDFIFIDDVVNVNLYLFKNPGISGIFNVGTGRCQSFNDVALAVVNCYRQNRSREAISLNEAVSNGEIMYIPMPDVLVGKYQSYTQADLNKLISTNYDKKFDDVAHGVRKYISSLDASV